MALKTRLTADEVRQHLHTLDGWQNHDDRITKTFTFQDFLAAISFINHLAPHAEELDHHPELFNVYNRVEIALTTHDADGLTALDFELARRLDELATPEKP